MTREQDQNRWKTSLGKITIKKTTFSLNLVDNLAEQVGNNLDFNVSNPAIMCVSWEPLSLTLGQKTTKKSSNKSTK